MQARPFKVGPLALGNATYSDNIFNPGTTTGGVNSTAAPFNELQFYMRRIRVTNVTAAPVTFRLFLGATGGNAAGTELAFNMSVPANNYVDLPYGGKPLTPADFIVGAASAAASLTIEIEGEIGVA